MTLAPPAAGARDLVPPDGIARTIDSPEGPIYYLETGEGEPLVLCSAWGPQPGSTAWLLYRDALEILSRHRRCVVVELTNYGHTGPVTFHEPTHDVTVRAVVRVMDHLGIEKATCVGTSQGATTVLDLALQHPDRVEALVLGACHASTGGDPYLLANFPGETWRLHEESQADPPFQHRVLVWGRRVSDGVHGSQPAVDRRDSRRSAIRSSESSRTATARSAASNDCRRSGGDPSQARSGPRSSASNQLKPSSLSSSATG